MSENIRIPVEIKTVKDPSGKTKLKATVPIGIVFIKDFDAVFLERELTRIERKYLYLIICLKSILNFIKTEKRRNSKVLLYWEIGDKILNFQDDVNNLFFIVNLTKSLKRDIGVSKKFISRCKKFRLKYPDLTEINPEKSFASYIEIFERGYKKGRKNENN